MLKSFEVFNFKSFTNKTTFELKQDESYKMLQENVDNDILKGLLFIGPNASGKTNSIHAINLLIELLNMEGSLAKYVNIFHQGYMYVKYNFVFNGVDLEYKIEYNSKTKLISEKLLVDSKEIFNVADRTKVSLRKFIDSQENERTLADFKSFLKNSYVIDLYNIKQSESKNSFKNPKVVYTKEVVNNINIFLEKYNFEIRLKDIEKPCEKDDLFFIKNGIDVDIPFEMESIGNRTLMYLVPIINKVLNNKGMLIMDEFGSGMHNSLEGLLIRHFMKNSIGSQMFLISHSTNLLSQNLLRPDQIISVDFENNSSVIYKLSSEKPRSSQNLEKMYLGGVFGGLPNFNEE